MPNIGGPLIIQDIIDYVNLTHSEWIDYYFDFYNITSAKGGLFYGFTAAGVAGVAITYEAYFHIIMGTDFTYTPSSISRSTPDGTLTLPIVEDPDPTVPAPGVFTIWPREANIGASWPPLFPNLATHLETAAFNVTNNVNAAKDNIYAQINALISPTHRVLSVLFRVYETTFVDPGTLEERIYKAYLAEVVSRSYP